MAGRQSSRANCWPTEGAQASVSSTTAALSFGGRTFGRFELNWQAETSLGEDNEEGKRTQVSLTWCRLSLRRLSPNTTPQLLPALFIPSTKPTPPPHQPTLSSFRGATVEDLQASPHSPPSLPPPVLTPRPPALPRSSPQHRLHHLHRSPSYVPPPHTHTRGIPLTPHGHSGFRARFLVRPPFSEERGGDADGRSRILPLSNPATRRLEGWIDIGVLRKQLESGSAEEGSELGTLRTQALKRFPKADRYQGECEGCWTGGMDGRERESWGVVEVGDSV